MVLERKLFRIFEMYSFPDTISEYNQAHYIAYHYAYTFCFFGHTLFTFVFVNLGSSYVLFNNTLCIFIDLLLLNLNSKGFHKTALTLWVVEISYHAFTCVLVFGWEPCFYYYILALAICVFIGRWPISLKLVLSFSLFFLQLLLYILMHYYLNPVITLSTEWIRFLYICNAAINLFAIIFLLYFYLRVIDNIESELKVTNESLKWAQEMMTTDLKMAVNVQRSFFQTDVPKSDDFDIALYFKPMMEVSGDLYDFIIEDGKLKGAAVFDVSGHGVASALITMISRSVIDKEFKNNPDEPMSSIIYRINGILGKEIGMTNSYLAGVMVRFKEDCFEYANAGSVDILLKKSNTGEVIVPGDPDQKYRCTFLGVPFLECFVEPVKIPVEKGDTLVLFSDGLVESVNSADDHYGIRRVRERVGSMPRTTSPHAMIEEIVEGLFEHTGTDKLNDDLTLVVIRKK